jgi:hypothetical protein
MKEFTWSVLKTGFSQWLHTYALFLDNNKAYKHDEEDFLMEGKIGGMAWL